MISTAHNEYKNYNISIPAGNAWDMHHYEQPLFFLKQFHLFDNWQQRTGNTNVSVLLGEYSVYSADTPEGMPFAPSAKDAHIDYPRLLSALAESIYLIGAERNPNVVRMSSYAPSFQKFNWVLTLDEWEKFIATNAWASMTGLQIYLPLLQARKKRS